MINTGHDVNVVNITGNLCSDVEWKTDESGNKYVGFFGVSTARKVKQEFVSDRHSIVVKGRAIENFPDIKKGDRVAIQGVLTYKKREGVNFPSAEIQLESIKAL